MLVLAFHLQQDRLLVYLSIELDGQIMPDCVVVNHQVVVTNKYDI